MEMIISSLLILYVGIHKRIAIGVLAYLTSTDTTAEINYVVEMDNSSR